MKQKRVKIGLYEKKGAGSCKIFVKLADFGGAA